MAEVTMYSTAYCGYCRAAKQFLKSRKGVDVKEIDVSADPERRRWLVKTTGQQTVPQIWVGETHVGGYDDLRALDAAGGLDPLLNAGI